MDLVIYTQKCDNNNDVEKLFMNGKENLLIIYDGSDYQNNGETEEAE